MPIIASLKPLFGCQRQHYPIVPRLQRELASRYSRFTNRSEHRALLGGKMAGGERHGQGRRIHTSIASRTSPAKLR
jgi:hypothetical protein